MFGKYGGCFTWKVLQGLVHILWGGRQLDTGLYLHSYTQQINLSMIVRQNVHVGLYVCV